VGERRLDEVLFGERRFPQRLPEHVLPDFSSLHQQLQQHPHLTLQLAWQEYRQVHPQGYGYSCFCELYGRWRRKQDVVLRQAYKPGEKGFVDWAGATISAARSSHWRDLASFVIPDGAGRQLLHLCRSHTGSTVWEQTGRDRMQTLAKTWAQKEK
jgi:hypothetical protein